MMRSTLSAPPLPPRFAAHQASPKFMLMLLGAAYVSPLQVEADFSLARFGFFLSAWDAQAALEQDILAHKCLLTEQEHKLFTFADRKVDVLPEGGGA